MGSWSARTVGGYGLTDRLSDCNVDLNPALPHEGGVSSYPATARTKDSLEDAPSTTVTSTAR